jgi:hypothetical protein
VSLTAKNPTPDRVSASRVGGRIKRIVAAWLCLVSPLSYLVFEHFGQPLRLMKLRDRTIKLRLETLYLLGSRQLLVL